MKRENIYIGDIKLCKNLYRYEQCYDKNTGYYVMAKVGNVIYGDYCILPYINDAILIKVSSDKYVWLDNINTIVDQFKCNFGFKLNTMGLKPTEENLLYVDECSLKPYFSNDFCNQSKNISVKTLKKNIKVNNCNQDNMIIK